VQHGTVDEHRDGVRGPSSDTWFEQRDQAFRPQPGKGLQLGSVTRRQVQLVERSVPIGIG
jgi:hypothetical protein